MSGSPAVLPGPAAREPGLPTRRAAASGELPWPGAMTGSSAVPTMLSVVAIGASNPSASSRAGALQHIVPRNWPASGSVHLGHGTRSSPTSLVQGASAVLSPSRPRASEGPSGGTAMRAGYR